LGSKKKPKKAKTKRSGCGEVINGCEAITAGICVNNVPIGGDALGGRFGNGVTATSACIRHAAVRRNGPSGELSRASASTASGLRRGYLLIKLKFKKRIWERKTRDPENSDFGSCARIFEKKVKCSLQAGQSARRGEEKSQASTTIREERVPPRSFGEALECIRFGRGQRPHRRTETEIAVEARKNEQTPLVKPLFRLTRVRKKGQIGKTGCLLGVGHNGRGRVAVTLGQKQVAVRVGSVVGVWEGMGADTSSEEGIEKALSCVNSSRIRL